MEAIDVLREASLKAVNHLNEIINSDYFINTMYYGYTLQDQLDDDISKDPKQSTQNLTKKIEPLLNAAMRRVIEEGDYGQSYETTGFDYIILDEEYEFKACGSKDVNSFATGGRSSAVSGVKTDKTWILKYNFSDNKISEIGVYLVDLGKCKNSKWEAGNKTNHNFSGLKVRVSDIDAVTPVIGTVDEFTPKGRKIGTYVRCNMVSVEDSCYNNDVTVFSNYA